jgi:hypothetical protein
MREGSASVWRAHWRYFNTDQTMKVPELDRPVRGLALPREVVDKLYRLNCPARLPRRLAKRRTKAHAVTSPAKTLKRQPPHEARRALLQWLGGATLLPAALPAPRRTQAAATCASRTSVLSLQFDAQMRCRLVDRRRGAARA